MDRPAMSPFQRAVRKVVRGIPRGTTLSYGEVALRAGKPQAARAVVAALHALGDVPWWRVARHDGTLAPQISRQQATLLRQEGWKPRPPRRKRG
jgi:O-6-methylguanine DNA methyltransferase